MADYSSAGYGGWEYIVAKKQKKRRTTRPWRARDFLPWIGPWRKLLLGARHWTVVERREVGAAARTFGGQGRSKVSPTGNAASRLDGPVMESTRRST